MNTLSSTNNIKDIVEEMEFPEYDDVICMWPLRNNTECKYENESILGEMTKPKFTPVINSVRDPQTLFSTTDSVSCATFNLTNLICFLICCLNINVGNVSDADRIFLFVDPAPFDNDSILFYIYVGIRPGKNTVSYRDGQKRRHNQQDKQCSSLQEGKICAGQFLCILHEDRKGHNCQSDDSTSDLLYNDRYMIPKLFIFFHLPTSAPSRSH